MQEVGDADTAPANQGWGSLVDAGVLNNHTPKKKKKQAAEEPTDIGGRWISIMQNKWFKYKIWLTVVISMILMMVDSPHTEYANYGTDWSVGNWRPDLLNAMELYCTLVYSFEAMVLILAKGWRPYFGNGRNFVQFIVVLAGWVKVLIYFAGGEANGGAVAILGGLRALRPWLVLSLQPDMNDIFLCLYRSIKALTSILSIMVFFFVIFGLIGMQLFPAVLKNRCIWNGTDVDNFTIDGTDGALTLANFSYEVWTDVEHLITNEATLALESRWLKATSYYDNCAFDAQSTGVGVACEVHYPAVILHCQPSCTANCFVTNETNLTDVNGSNITACEDFCVELCANYSIPMTCNSTGMNPDWQPVNFDNFGWAIMTLFTCIIAVGWTDIQYKFQDAYHWIVAVYFILVMVVGMWVILNMAIAVLADAYNDQDSKKEEAAKQRRIVERAELRATALEDKASGIVREKPPLTPLQRWKARCDLPEARVKRAALNRLVENKFFKAFFLMAIVGNTILVSMFDPYRSGWKQNAYDVAGWVWAAFFYLEMFLKIGGVGSYAYFTDLGHLGDASMNLLAFCELMMIAAGYDRNDMNYMFVRSLRVFRVLRVAAASENLREVLMSAARSLKVITAIAVVMMMFLYFMAIVAMQLFGGSYNGPDIADCLAMQPEDGRVCTGSINAHNQPLHFDYFIVALANIFTVATTENWIGFMWTCYDTNGVGSIIFFVVVIVFGNIVILNMFLAILLDQMDDELKSKVRKQDEERSKAAFIENRAARKMQTLARAGKFANKLLAKSKASSDEEKFSARASGRTTGFADSNKDFPLLSPWEISTYTIIWNTTTKETGGKLPLKSLQNFLVLIGQRLEHAPERVARDVESGLREITERHAVDDEDDEEPGEGQVELWEILKVVNRKRVKEIQVNRKRSTSSQAEDKAKSQLPARTLCFDANVAMLHPLSGIACGMGPNSKIRYFALLLFYSPARRFTTSMFIFLSGSLSGLRFTQRRPDGFRSDVEEALGTEGFDSMVYLVDIVFEILMFGEIGLKMLIAGVYSDPKRSYFRPTSPGFGWRLVDIIISFLTLIALCFDLSGSTPPDDDSSARPYKMVQAFKLLSLIPRIHVTKVMAGALLVSLPKVAMMALVTLIVLFAFATSGVFIFGGTFGFCSIIDLSLVDTTAGAWLEDTRMLLPEGPDLFGFAPVKYGSLTYGDCTGAHTGLDMSGTGMSCTHSIDDEFGRILVEVIPDRYTCDLYKGLEWAHHANPHFDDVGHAMLALFQCMFTDGWSGILSYATSGRGYQLQPWPESRLFGPLMYFWFWYVAGALFFLNLIVGTVVSTFMELLDEDSGMTGPVDRPLSDEQRRWVYTQQVLQTTKMVKLYSAPVEGCCLRMKRFYFRLVTAREEVLNPEKRAYYGNFFNGSIMAVICFNIVMMLIKTDDASESTAELYIFTNTIFSGVYGLEFFFKWQGLGWKQYIKDDWNKFDFVMIVLQMATGVSTSAAYFTGMDVPSMNVSYLKALRSLRLGKYSKSFRLLLATLKFGFPALCNIVLLLYIVLYVFAMLGMVLFGGMTFIDDPSSQISKHANFNTVYMSLQTVFRLATGDSWSGFYLDAQHVRFPVAGVDGAEQTILPVNAQWVHAWFVIFMFTSLIIISVFIAIILNYYGIQTDLTISEMESSDFSYAWIKFDPDNTAYIPVWRLGELVASLDQPWSPIKLIKPANMLNKAVALTEEDVEERRVALDEFMDGLVIPVRGQGRVHFTEVLVAIAEVNEGNALPSDPTAPDGLCKIQKTLLSKWPKMAPDLLALPPREKWSKELNSDILAVVHEGASWEAMQEAYVRTLLGLDDAAPEVKKTVRLAEEQVKKMPSLAKLSSYLAADEIDDTEVRKTLQSLKEHETMAAPRTAPARPQPAGYPAPVFDASRQIYQMQEQQQQQQQQQQLSRLGQGQGQGQSAGRRGSANIMYQDAPPMMSSHLIEAWVRIRADLQSEDTDRQLTGLVLIRKLLSSTGRTKHMQVFRGVLANECVARFVFFLQEADTPTQQYEASWALTNICADAQCVQAVVKHGALPIIVQLARNRHDNVAIQALHAVGNIAKDAELREVLMVQGALQVVLEQLNPQIKLPVLRMATWCLAAICGVGQGGPGRSWAMIAPAALTILPHLLGSEDDELLTQGCRALAALGEARDPSSSVNCDHIQSIIESNCLPRVVALMARPGVELPKAALRVAANIVTGDNAQAQAVVDAGALPAMRELLKQPDKAIRKECCWALSSVMAGTEEQLQQVVQADVFGQITRLLATEGPLIQKEAAWCIINSVSGGNTAQIKYFVEHGAIKALCDLLARPDLMGPAQPLEALEYVLKHGTHAGESYMALVDIFKLKQLGDHAEPQVRKRAIRILDMVVNAAPFFGGEANVFVPRGLLTDRTLSPEERGEGGVLVKHLRAGGGTGVDEADVKAAWSTKWAASAAVAEEASEDKARIAATEALADTMYRDFFDGDDPFGVLDEEEAEEEAEESPVRRGARGGARRGHKGSKRAAKGESALPAGNLSASV